MKMLPIYILIEPLPSPDWPLSFLKAIKLIEKERENDFFPRKSKAIGLQKL